jgi:hypothetical protein
MEKMDIFHHNDDEFSKEEVDEIIQANNVLLRDFLSKKDNGLPIKEGENIRIKDGLLYNCRTVEFSCDSRGRIFNFDGTDIGKPDKVKGSLVHGIAVNKEGKEINKIKHISLEGTFFNKSYIAKILKKTVEEYNKDSNN